MKRILLVDDDVAIRCALADALRAAGYDVTAAEEREEAEALLTVERFDLVITDLRLCDLNGFSGLQVLSEAVHRLGPARVLAMTGHANPLVESAVRDAGAELIRKPFTLSRCLSICEGKVQQCPA